MPARSADSQSFAPSEVRIRLRRGSGGRGFFEDERSIDLPSPCVMASGIGASGRHQALINAPTPAASEVRVENGKRVRVRKRLAPSNSGYQVPTMADVARAKGSNGLTMVSTFSGCGGSCLGFEMSGYNVLWANEFVPAAREVYALNHPGVILDGSDLRGVTAAKILAATGLKVGELDVLEGSPPCASFSRAGKREKGWGKVKKYSDTRQRTDDLFFEYARLLRDLQPRAFVAENVAGLVAGIAWGYFEEILRTLRGCGYRVKAKVLDAQWLGVPQTRNRLILIGVREDLQIAPVHPLPLSGRYSIRDALPHLNGAAVMGQEVVGRVRKRVDLRPGDLQFALHVGGKTNFRKGRVWSGSRPSPTILASGLGGVAPTDVLVQAQREMRQFTIPELQRLCSFPDDFKLTGSFTQQWERLGRAVPPVMMFHVARTLRDHVFKRLGRVVAGAREARPT